MSIWCSVILDDDRLQVSGNDILGIREIFNSRSVFRENIAFMYRPEVRVAAN